MRFYDRYNHVYVEPKSMPQDLDLGRYALESGIDLINSITDNDNKHYVNRRLLEDNEEDYLRELFKDFNDKVAKSDKGGMSILPLIQKLSDGLERNKFDDYLCEKIPNLIQITRQPHYLLKRVTEKVRVSRAKRIPFKSYQYLAAHTEDWEERSIVNFKPIRILSDEYDLNYDVYENQLFLALVERCIQYLEKKLAKVRGVADFLELYKQLNEDYKNSLDSHKNKTIWFEKVSRNLKLVGEIYKNNVDVHYLNTDKYEETVGRTRKKLNKAYSELLRIRSSDLFNEVNKRAAKNVTLHDTNVLVNHKHYRYVRILWRKLPSEKSEQEIKDDQQLVMDGLRAYAKVLFSYTVSHLNYNDNLNYIMNGSYSSWSAINDRLTTISLKEANDKTLEVNIGKRRLRFVVTGNISSVDTHSLPAGTYLLCYSQERSKFNDRVILIDPRDPDSVERLGAVINRYLISEYVSNIQREYPYPQALRDYIGEIDAPWVHFYNEHNHYTYSFLKPRVPIDKRALSAKLVVGRDIRDDQKKELLKLVDEIERNYAEFVTKSLFCFHCHTPFNENTLEDFKYMACPMEDGFVLDISQPGRIILKNIDERYSSDNVDWGLDCMDFLTSSL